MSSSQRGDFLVDRRVFVLASLSVPIGIICAFVALALIHLINLFTNIFYFHDLSLQTRAPTNSFGIWSVFVPVVGGLIIGLMARFGSERIRGHGIPEALEAILFGKSILKLKVAILKPLSSAISIGSGGPFGAEGPIIMTGGAFGSLFAQLFHLSSTERKTLLVSGAAAGMAAVFGTPVAAVLLAVELLLFEWRPRSIVPVAIASAVAAGLRPLVLGSQVPLFSIPPIETLSGVFLISALFVGIFAGIVSWFISNCLYKLEDQFLKLPVHWMWWPAIGGLGVGIGGYFQPEALGVGYPVIGTMLAGNQDILRCIMLIFTKFLVWIIALASGTSGGVLAPLLIMGAGLGAVEAHFLSGPASLWPLVSMAAVMGGMMRSPITAILFALELTYCVQALPAITIGCFAAYATTVLVMKRSILTEKVARRGFDIFREYTVDPLEMTSAKDIMTRDVTSLKSTDLLESAMQHFIGNQKPRGYPILDSNKCLSGIVTATDMIDWAADEKKGSKKTLYDLIKRKPVVGFPNESCRLLAERMAVHNVGRLPIVTKENPGNIIGIVTRSDLLKVRAMSYSAENHREAVRIFRKEEPLS